MSWLSHNRFSGDDVRLLVLDEADRILDMGFQRVRRMPSTNVFECKPSPSRPPGHTVVGLTLCLLLYSHDPLNHP